jgi:hypothetical protein
MLLLQETGNKRSQKSSKILRSTIYYALTYILEVLYPDRGIMFETHCIPMPYIIRELGTQTLFGG